MKNENGGGNIGEVQSAVGSRKADIGGPGARELVFPVPAGEQDFLATLMQFMRSAMRSQDREVARAARRWEMAIGFRIKMALQERGRAASRSGGRPTVNRTDRNQVKGRAGL